MVTTTVQMIYLGNLPIIDIDESDTNAENAGVLAGTYHSFVDGLEIVTVDNNDSNFDGKIYDDDGGGSDSISYTHSGGTFISQTVDASISYSAIVTDLAGTQHNINLMIVQAVNGDTFVGDLLDSGDLDNITIRSIELVAPQVTDVSGYTSSYSVSNSAVCFGTGTLIETARGFQRVDQLGPGDQVVTVDRGPQRIVRVVRMKRSAGRGLPPVQVSAGALGPGLPRRVLEVTAQHRLLIASPVATRMFGVPEVLVPAHLLTCLPGIRFLKGRLSFDCVHLMLDRHELIWAEGVPAETLLPGALPVTYQGAGRHRMVRRAPSVALLRKMMKRQKKNGLPLLTDRFVRFPADADQ